MVMDPIGDNRFRARSNQRNINGVLYGGQVIGQALSAACSTISADRRCNSMHAYFLRGGNCELPVECAVEPTRDGAGFATRRVVAEQGGEKILHMECSFRRDAPGMEHEIAGPDVPFPEDLPSMSELVARHADKLPPHYAEMFTETRPIEVRPVEPEQMIERLERPDRSIWIRVPSASATDDAFAHQQILAYMSDYWLSGVVPAAHVAPVAQSEIFIASVDHAVWFHRPARADEWMLYHTSSSFAGYGTGVSRGMLYDRERRPVASVMQEAVIRQRRS